MLTTRIASLTAGLLGVAALGPACVGTVMDDPGGTPGSDVPGSGPGASGERTATAGAGAGTGAAGGPSARSCPAGAPLALSLQRLGAWQLRGVVRDAIKPTLELGSSFPATATLAAPYSTWPEANPMSELAVGGIADTAEAIADAVTDSLPACSGAGEAACMRSALAGMAEKLFRRPAAPEELDPIAALTATLRADLVPREALALGLAALLQHPRTLYLVARAGAPPDGRALAERIALVYRGGLPDDGLLAAAGDGRLATGKGRAAEATRLLQTPRGADAMARFLFEWMRGEGFVADQFKAPVQASLQAELVLLLQAALTEPGGFASLLTSPRGFVDATLESFYGLPPGPKDAGGWRAVDLGASGRVGILTHPLLMARTAHGMTPSVVLRGKFVRLGLLCGELAPPPAGASADQPVLPRGATERDASDARMKLPACGGCHRLMDPIGLGLLGIDGVGHPRADDAHGEILDGGNISGPFSGAAELGRRLAASDDVARCFARQWFRYAFGRQDRAAGALDDRDQCAVDTIMTQFVSSGRRLETLFSTLASLDGFAAAGVSP